MAAKKPSKKSKLTMAQKSAIAGYLWISPFIIGFIFFLAAPLIESVRMAFSLVSVDFANHSFSLEWTGLKNMDYAMNYEPTYKRTLVETLTTMAAEVLAVLIFAYFVAILLNQKFKGRGFVRAVFFLPVILSSGILVGLDTSNGLLSSVADAIKESNNAASSITGVLEKILVSENGRMSSMLETIFELVNKVYDIAISSGIQIIIFLSGLQTIPASMYEASTIEGATAWESFWKITFPMTSSLILVNVVYTVVDFCTRSDNNVMSLINSVMGGRMEYGLASAMAWIYFAIVGLAIAVISLIISRWVYYYE